MTLHTDEKFVNTTVLLRHLPLGLFVPLDMFRILAFLSFKYKLRVEEKKCKEWGMSPLKKIMVIKPNIKSKLSTTKPTLLIQVTQKLYQNPSLDEFKFISRQGKQNS